jgi:hypothetical protein
MRWRFAYAATWRSSQPPIARSSCSWIVSGRAGGGAGSSAVHASTDAAAAGSASAGSAARIASATARPSACSKSVARTSTLVIAKRLTPTTTALARETSRVA